MKSFFIVLLFSCYLGFSQALLKPDRVFDGTEMHENWVVLVEENLITYAGKLSDMDLPDHTTEIELEGTTLMPGIIEGLPIFYYTHTMKPIGTTKFSKSLRLNVPLRLRYM